MNGSQISSGQLSALLLVIAAMFKEARNFFIVCNKLIYYVVRGCPLNVEPPFQSWFLFPTTPRLVPLTETGVKKDLVGLAC